MTNTFSSENVGVTEQDQIPASGQWSFDLEEPRQISCPQAQSPRFPPWLAAVVFVVPALTSGAHAWPDRGHHQFPASSQTIRFQPLWRRCISILDAGTMAVEILERAEAGRVLAADEEARRGLQVEDL